MGREESRIEKRTWSFSEVSAKVSANPSGCSKAGMTLGVVWRWDKGSGMYLLYPNVDQSLDVGYPRRVHVTLDKIPVFSQGQFF